MEYRDISGVFIEQAMYDAHCHVSTDFGGDVDALVDRVRGWSPTRFVVMSTNHLDYQLVDTLAEQCDNVVPAFGVHPWYAHLFSLDISLSKEEHYSNVFGKEVDDELLAVLPQPMDFDAHMGNLVEACRRHGKVCWGEVGLDKLARVPTSGFYGNGEFKGESRLSPYKVSMDHQKLILKRQLEVAIANDWAVSIHNVKAGGALHDVLKEVLAPSKPTRLCLHSYTGSKETLRMFQRDFKHHKIFVSVSSMVNGDKPQQLNIIMDTTADGCLLTETDCPLDRMDPGPLLETINRELTNAVKCGELDSFLSA